MTTIPSIRIGFDRLVFSAPPAFTVHPEVDPAKDVPQHLLGDQRLEGGWLPTKGTSGWYLKYRHGTEESFQILYKPWRLQMPLFRVVFNASMKQFLDLDQLEALIAALTTATGVKLKLAEVGSVVNLVEKGKRRHSPAV